MKTASSNLLIKMLHSNSGAKLLSRACILTLVVALVGAPLGCSNKDEAGSTSTAVAGPTPVPTKSLLDAVPSDAVAVSAFDSTSSGYAKWKLSPYGALAAKLQGFSTASLQTGPQADALKGFTALMNGVKQTGLFAFDPAQKDSSKEVVYFVTVGAPKAPNSPPSFGMAYYFSAAAGVNMKEKLSQLAASLETQGFKPTKSSANGIEQFQVKLLNETDAPMASPLSLDTLYAAASDDKLALASTDSLNKHLFEAAETPGLTTTEQFKASLQYLPANRSDAVGIGYFDLKLLAATIAASAPQAEREKIKAGIASMPFESLTGYLAVEDHPVMHYSLPFQPRDESQKKWFSILQSAKAPAVLKSSPADSILAIALDGSSLQAIKETALAQTDPAQAAAMQQQLALLDQVHGLGIGLSNAAGASPFPEVFILADTDKGADLAATVKLLASGITASSGMPATPWQTKQIAGVNVDFMLSPIGVGLFIGSSGNTMFIASSEATATAIISTATQKSPALSGTNKELDSGAAFAAFLNLGKLHGFITSMQGTLAMFTGGQSSFDPSQIAILKELGSVSTTVTCDAKALHVTAHLRPEVVK